MTTVTFYEKPGCSGNARQKALLEAAGHTLIVKNLKAEPWTSASLLDFLSPLPVGDWFNRGAQAIKDGEIVPEQLSPEQALSLLIENPLLIRRPLMAADGAYKVGFDAEAVAAWIGLADVEAPAGNLEACVHGPDGGSCPEPGETAAAAEDHACGCGSHGHAGKGNHGSCGGH
jgi:nitrogenase-associated protein